MLQPTSSSLRWDGYVVVEAQNGTKPYESSSTNHLKDANLGSRGNKKKQEVMVMSLCFELFPHVDENHLVLFSLEIRDVLQHVCAPVMSAQSH